MDRDRFRLVMSIVDRMFDTPPVRWEAKLRELCGDDGELRKIVERLVHVDGAMESGFLKSPAPSREICKAVIDRFLEEHGERSESVEIGRAHV